MHIRTTNERKKTVWRYSAIRTILPCTSLYNALHIIVHVIVNKIHCAFIMRIENKNEWKKVVFGGARSSREHSLPIFNGMRLFYIKYARFHWLYACVKIGFQNVLKTYFTLNARSKPLGYSINSNYTRASEYVLLLLCCCGSRYSTQKPCLYKRVQKIFSVRWCFWACTIPHFFLSSAFDGG